MRLSDEEKARRKAERDAVQAEQIRQWVEKVVAEAPPLTPSQISLIAGIFLRQREEDARAAERAKKPPARRPGRPGPPPEPDFQI